jgi:hypothetical protein
MPKKKKKRHGVLIHTTITGRVDGKGPVRIAVDGDGEPGVVMNIGKVDGQIVGTQVVRGDQINYFR